MDSQLITIYELFDTVSNTTYAYYRTLGEADKHGRLLGNLDWDIGEEKAVEFKDGRIYLWLGDRVYFGQHHAPIKEDVVVVLEEKKQMSHQCIHTANDPCVETCSCPCDRCHQFHLLLEAFDGMKDAYETMKEAADLYKQAAEISQQGSNT